MTAPEPVLAEVTRGTRIESRHRGALVLLDPAGSVGLTCGSVEVAVFARSALKPLQALALLDSGFAPQSPALALACASHDGAQVHREGVRAVLAGAGLAEDALGCPPDLPWGRDALVSYLAGGGKPAAVCHNCSGKHAAMLATCVAAGWDVGSYLDPGHPLQQAVVATIEKVGASAVAESSVDGCGAPAHAISLEALARGFAVLAAGARGSYAGAVRDAMRAHPELVGGVGRAVTDLLAEVDGLVTKDGAEGVWAGALPDGRAFAVKIGDGAARALPPVVAAVLLSWGLDGAAVRRWAQVPVLGGTSRVGEIRASTELARLLS